MAAGLGEGDEGRDPRLVEGPVGLWRLEQVADGPQAADDVWRQVGVRQHVRDQPMRLADDGRLVPRR